MDTDNAARRAIAGIYDEMLAPLETAGKIAICRPAKKVTHAHHQYVIRIKDRASLQSFCSARGVGTAVHYPAPVHLQPAYLDRKLFPLAGNTLPETEAAGREVLSLPMFPQLDEASVRKAAQAVLNRGRE